jgi:capsular exopolysaccharide synthesis family protein
MEPIHYLRIFRQRWKLVALCIGIAFAAAWATTPAHPRSSKPITSYRADATLLQAPGSTTSLGYIALFVRAGEIPTRVAQQLHYKGDPAVLASTITVTPNPSVGSLDIASVGGNGQQLADTVNAFADQTRAYFREQAQAEHEQELATAQSRLDKLFKIVTDLDKAAAADPHNAAIQAQRTAEASQYGAAYTSLQQLISSKATAETLTVLQKATPIPVISGGFTAPSSRTARVLIGVVIGLLLGLGLALALERLDTRLRSRSAVQRATGVPVLAEVPRVPRRQRRDHPVAVIRDPVGPVAEAYRNVRSALLLMPSVSAGTVDAAEGLISIPTPARKRGAGAHVVLVTSGRSREGKTTTVANLAACLAETGKSVLVLDCDFRHPDVHTYLDVRNSSGLSDALVRGPIGLAPIVRPTGISGVQVATAGLSTEEPALLPTRMEETIRSARHLADVVIIDAAPLLHANDALDLMPFVDSVLLVCRAGRTNAEQAERVTELLARMRVPVVGVALIGVRSGSGWRGAAYGYYNYNRSSGRIRRRKSRRPTAGERYAPVPGATRDDADPLTHERLVQPAPVGPDASLFHSGHEGFDTDPLGLGTAEPPAVTETDPSFRQEYG